MKKNRYLIIIFVVIALVVSISVIYKNNFSDSNNKGKNLNFINTKIFISGSIGEEMTFPVIFFLNKHYKAKDIIDDVQLINSNGAEISDWELIDGSEYKDSKLNNISVSIKLTKEGENKLGGIQIRLKDGTKKEIPFDDWNIDVTSNSPSNFMVATKESYIASNKNVLFDIKNNSDSIIKISGLDLISDKIKIKNGIFKDNKKTYDSLDGIQLSKSGILELNFETEISEKCDIYFIRPRLEYILNGITYKEPITQGAVYGLQFDEAKMSDMYKKCVEKVQ